MSGFSVSTSFISIKAPHTVFISSGLSMKPTDHSLLCIAPYNVSRKPKLTTQRRPFTVVARHGSAGIFIAGFVLGGIVVGTLGCIYAPQISKALAGADRKDLMRKLPKFIYDEEKALEKTRKILAEKIAQLNSAIDEVSAQLHADNASNGGAINSDEIQASM